jgi:predicted  nucleic acid-binding Zn-ribbon protein
MVRAAALEQWRLLDLQEHDTVIMRLEHRRATLPEIAALADLAGRLRQVGDQVIGASSKLTDLRRELIKAEGDVDQVQSRITRNQARLDLGQGSAKELQAMQAEQANLGQRHAELEDLQLVAMERVEQAEELAAGLGRSQIELTAEHDQLTAKLEGLRADLDQQIAVQASGRATISQALPADLVALYERRRAQNGGVGAARLEHGRCGGCNLQLALTELRRYEQADADEVQSCEECQRILIRVG